MVMRGVARLKKREREKKETVGGVRNIFTPSYFSATGVGGQLTVGGGGGGRVKTVAPGQGIPPRPGLTQTNTRTCRGF